MPIFQDAPGTPGTVVTGTTGVVQQDSLDSATRFCTPTPVPVPSLDAEAYLPSQDPGQDSGCFTEIP